MLVTPENTLPIRLILAIAGEDDVYARQLQPDPMLRGLRKACLNGSAQLVSDCNGNVCHLKISLAEFEAPQSFADCPNQKSDANQRKNQDGQSLGTFQVSLFGMKCALGKETRFQNSAIVHAFFMV